MVSAVLDATRATLPLVALIALPPLTSWAGSVAPVVPLVPMRTSTERPGCTGASPVNGVTDQPPPVELVYWTDQVEMSTAVVPRLSSSMKSYL